MNTGAQERIFLGHVYTPTAVRAEDDSFEGPHCRALRASARCSGDRRLARLLGDDDQLAARQNSGFVVPPDEEWAVWRTEDDEHAHRNAAALAEARRVREELHLR